MEDAHSRGTSGEDHELLEGKLVAGVGATVDDVEARDGENVRGLDTGDLSEMLVEGDALGSGSGLGGGHRDTEDGVGAEVALVGGLDRKVSGTGLRPGMRGENVRRRS